jgi:hypothetical protein
LLFVFDGDAPFLNHVLARDGRIGPQWRAIRGLLRLTAGLNSLQHVERLSLAHDDVVAARVKRVACVDIDPAIAIAARHLQTADDAPPMQVAIVQPALGQPVGLLIVQIGFGEQLPRKEARPIQALKAGARATAAT